MKIDELRQKVQEAGLFPLFHERDDVLLVTKWDTVSVYARYSDDMVYQVYVEIPIRVGSEMVTFAVFTPASLAQIIFDIVHHFTETIARIRYLCNVYNYEHDEHETDAVAVIETYSNRTGLRYFAVAGAFYDHYFSSYFFPEEFLSITAALDYVRNDLEMRFRR